MINRWKDQFLWHPALFLPEALMEYELTVEDGTTYNYLDVCSRNYHHFENRWSFKLA